MIPLRRVAILGAGFVGGEIARRLIKQGVEVIATTRSGVADGVEGAEIQALDVTRAGAIKTLESILEHVDAIVIAWAPKGADRRSLYIGGMDVFAAAYMRPSVPRAVLLSSTSATPERDGLVDESVLDRPTSERGQIQREAEERFSRTLDRAGGPWVILRLAGLYGPGRPVTRATNLIHRDAAANATIAALTTPAATGQIIHVCEDRPPDQPIPTGAKVVDNRKMKLLLGPS